MAERSDGVERTATVRILKRADGTILVYESTGELLMSPHSDSHIGRWALAELETPPADNEESYDYSGRVYFRPIGRGICLIDRDGGGDQLEDLYFLDSKMYAAEIRLRRLSTSDTATAEKEWKAKLDNA